MKAWIDLEPDGDENPLAWGIWDDANERIDELLEALQEIARAPGRYGVDQLIATDVLRKVYGRGAGMRCAGCGKSIPDEQIWDMVSDINEHAQYHEECWLKTGKIAWGTNKEGRLYFVGGKYGDGKQNKEMADTFEKWVVLKLEEMFKDGL